MLPYQHVGYHFSCNKEHRKGLFHGVEKKVKNEDGEEDSMEVCSQVIPDIEPTFFFVERDGKLVPHMAFSMFGSDITIPVYRFPSIMKEYGLPFSTRESRDIVRAITNHVSFLRGLSDSQRIEISDLEGINISHLHVPVLYDHLGYRIENGTVHVIDFRSTTMYRDGGETINMDVNEVRRSLIELLSISSDPKAAMIALAYGVMAPLAGEIKKRRKFFPNLAFIGSPEAGKSTLLNLFLALGWGTEDNIKVSQDFKTEFASLKNMEGSGLPLVINDLKQEFFDQIRDLILSSTDGKHGGSRGTQYLQLQQIESERAFAISSNWLQLGTQEIADRIIAIEVHGKRGNEARWNQLASRLKGVTYHIAKDFFDGKIQDFDDMLEFFDGSRQEIKDSIIQIGTNAIAIFLQPICEMPREILTMEWEEYRQEDYLSMLLSWAELQYEEMRKKYTVWEDERGERVPVYQERNYIRLSRSQDGNNQYVIFPYAFSRFLKDVGPNFPFRSMAQFADRYRDNCVYQARKFQGKDGAGRESFKVLIVTARIEEDEEPMEDDNDAIGRLQKLLAASLVKKESAGGVK